jgi:adenylate kinase
MNIVLLGPPGAGKGTQARILQTKHQLSLISTGEILKEEIKNKTSLGVQVKEAIEAGKFISDDLLLHVFEDHLKTIKGQGMILDGVPRTLNQAQKIDALFEKLGITIDAAIQLDVNDRELINRLSKRVVCKTCHTSYTAELPPSISGVCDKCQGTEFIRRPDDEPEAIKTRLEIYNAQTKPLIQYYSESDRLRIVDGMKSVEEVKQQIESHMEDISKGSQNLSLQKGDRA